MCTVTFVPGGNSFHFTSSRDEQTGRPTALFPAVDQINGIRVLFPRDPLAGGSWIAVNENGHVAVLLNGAIKAHHSEPPYLKSRGLVLLDLISSISPANVFEIMDFKGIEPFTVVLFENRKLYSCKWDGTMKWLEPLSIQKPHIWSSVTLYNPAAIRKRESWFNEWLSEHLYPGTLDIFHFHQKGGDGDPFNDILMNRNHELFTNSISSIRLSRDTASFRYLDLRSGDTVETQLSIPETMAVKA